MIQLNIFQRIVSSIIPIKVWRGSSQFNPVLELFYYKGEWQLGTKDALYSTGTRYTPLLKGFKAIHDIHIKNQVLFLGAGLGSGVAILGDMGYFPAFTLVEIDDVIIDLAGRLMPDQRRLKGTFVQADAEIFVATCTARYDLVVIDIFISRKVPQFVSKTSFLNDCKALLNADGYIVANYMIDTSDEWEVFLTNWTEVFPKGEIITVGINKVLIAELGSLNS